MTWDDFGKNMCVTFVFVCIGLFILDPLGARAHMGQGPYGPGPMGTGPPPHPTPQPPHPIFPTLAREGRKWGAAFICLHGGGRPSAVAPNFWP